MEQSKIDFEYPHKITDVEKDLFINLKLPMETVLKILSGHNSDKTRELCKKMAELQPSHFESEEEKEQMVMQRVEDWKQYVGIPDVSLIVAMHEQWHTPIEMLMKGRLSPVSIKQLLDHYIVGQDEYKESLSVAFCMHLARKEQSDVPMAMPKSSLLVHGPTGNGKTHSLAVLAKLFDIPLAVIHCNSEVPTGIIGASIPDAFTDMYMQTKSEKAMEHSIVFFDEFDKLLPNGNNGGYLDYANSIINEMLNIIDTHGEVVFDDAYGREKNRTIHLSTENMMFVFAGVFEGLEQTVEKRINSYGGVGSIGFLSSNRLHLSNLELRHIACDDDFIELGVKPEIMGRIGGIVHVEELSEMDLVQVLDKAHPSIIQQYEAFFKQYGVKLEITQSAKQHIAKVAADRHLGARGVVKVLAEVLADAMRKLDVAPIGEKKELIVDEKYVIEKIKY